MDNNALILALIPAVASLVLGIYNVWVQYKKNQEEIPIRDATASKILSEASETVAKQYGELLDRVKKDFQEKLLELKSDMDELKRELKVKDETIAHLELENEKLKVRVAELETELKSWKEIKGVRDAK